ncbi:hypothetical protein CEUSTIGMA_g11299.t1 [Chlamydomonas eustigma]|uniref:PH domain-containing protein n=1 Tax=Chlamydomonas eustigma TaxID=1157962 RepID=A0A250XLC1_9CHLO|nr:hypothetical protein CEUSTIGMA_g11299.t1 [Chlamydomonas eustigma]|eukprot:GAX83874.1 hypothetical protein CEUSTIGMA_g11299.t1 [Chlamydomonas eustigma]
MAAVILDGYLLKKKRDSKSSLLSSKYQKRYFELTADTLAYACYKTDFRPYGGDGKSVQVFNVEELEYVKTKKKVNLEMKFPDRLLRVKAESSNEADRWEVELQKAHMLKVNKQAVVGGGGGVRGTQFDSPLKNSIVPPVSRGTLTHLTIEADSDDGDEDPGDYSPMVNPRVQQPQPIRTFMTMPSQFSFEKTTFSSATTSVASYPTNVDDVKPTNGPPSPRSLLANPKIGSTLIAQTAQHMPVGEEEEEEQQNYRRGDLRPGSRWDNESDDERPAPSSGRNEAAAVPPQSMGSKSAHGSDTAVLQPSLSDTTSAPAPASAAPQQNWLRMAASAAFADADEGPPISISDRPIIRSCQPERLRASGTSTTSSPARTPPSALMVQQQRRPDEDEALVLEASERRAPPSRARQQDPSPPAGMERLVLEEGGFPRTGSMPRIAGGTASPLPGRPPRAQSMARGERPGDEDGQEVLVLGDGVSPSGRPPLHSRTSRQAQEQVLVELRGSAERGSAKSPAVAVRTGSPLAGIPQQKQQGRTGSAASSLGRTSQVASSANSGTEGDENWLASDWDSSDEDSEDEGVAVHQPNGRPSNHCGQNKGAVPSKREPDSEGGGFVEDQHHQQGTRVARQQQQQDKDSDWDSDDNSRAGSHRRSGNQQTHVNRGRGSVIKSSERLSGESPRGRSYQDDSGVAPGSFSPKSSGAMQSRPQLNDSSSRFRRDNDQVYDESAALANDSHGLPKCTRQGQKQESEVSRRMLPADADKNFVEEDWDEDDD